MRAGVECLANVVLGTTGSITVELHRQGLPTLSDEREYRIVEVPEPKKPESKTSLPDFDVIPVAGPNDELWENICDDPEDTDVTKHASNFTLNKGRLYIYYSEAFPRFADEARRFEQQNEALANSFRTRYETWLAVHSLLMHEEMDSAHMSDSPSGSADELRRQERTRLAAVAAMVASQEVTAGASSDDENGSMS